MITPIAVLLAGGSGTRFKPFVSDKILWPFMGKPLGIYTIEAMIAGGIEEIVIITNTSNHEYFKSLSFPKTRITLVTQKVSNGMAGAVLTARNEIAGKPILISNCHDIFSPDLIKSIVSHIQTSDTKILLAGLGSDKHLPVGYLNIKNDQVHGIVEKPTLENKPSNYIKLVMDYFKNSDLLINELESFSKLDKSDSIYEDALSNILPKCPADFVKYRNYWSKLKYPNYVLDIMEILQTNTISSFSHASAKVSEKAIIEGDVYIDENAIVEAGAIVKGKTYIGRNARIGNNSLVRSSFIESGSTIGFGSEIARSYVGPNCQIHHGFVGDSVLESDVNASWGTVTANLRIDGKSVRLDHPVDGKIETYRSKLGAMIAKGAFLGINTSLMPGVCISASMQTIPGTIIKKTI